MVNTVPPQGCGKARNTVERLNERTMNMLDVGLRRGALSFLAKMGPGILGSLERLWRRVFQAKQIIWSRHISWSSLLGGIMELVHRELSITTSSKPNLLSLLCPCVLRSSLIIVSLRAQVSELLPLLQFHGHQESLLRG